MRTDKQERFIESYCLTGNAAKAAEMAGYSKKGLKQMGHMLKQQFEREIEDRKKKMIQDAVPAALTQISRLSTGAESENVRLSAAKDILDRAGLKPTEKIQQEVAHVETASTDELKRELEALLGTSQPEEIPDLVN